MKRRKRKPMHEVAIQLVEEFAEQIVDYSRKKKVATEAVCTNSERMQACLLVLESGRIPRKQVPDVARRLETAANKLLRNKRAVSVKSVATDITLLRMAARSITDDRWDI